MGGVNNDNPMANQEPNDEAKSVAQDTTAVQPTTEPEGGAGDKGDATKVDSTPVGPTSDNPDGPSGQPVEGGSNASTESTEQSPSNEPEITHDEKSEISEGVDESPVASE